MTNKILFAVAILFYCNNLIFSADNLTLKNGSKVECKIIGEDSIYLNIIINRNGNELKTKVLKADVQNISFTGIGKDNIAQTANIQNKDIANEKIIYPFYNSSISLLIGPGFVLGDFAATDIEKNSGFAKKGYSLAYLYYTYKYDNNFEFGCKLYREYNQFNSGLFIDNFNKTTGSSWELNADGWTVNGLFLGLVENFKTSNFQFEGRVLPGLMELKSPTLKFSLPSQNESFEFLSSYGMSFGYNIGLGAKYLIAPGWGFRLDGDYLGSVIKISNRKATASNGTVQLFKGAQYKINIVSVTIGLFYTFEIKYLQK
jgi:hypothetical protein